MRHAALAFALSVALGALAPQADAAAAGAKATEPVPASLGALLDEQTMRTVRHDPEWRTLLGISGDGIDLSGQLSDISLPRREELRAAMRHNLEELRQWRAAHPLRGQDRWSHDLAVWLY